MALRLAQDGEADSLLERDPLALLIGMLLDQQIPMEKAFSGPQVLAERLGVDRLDAGRVAACDPGELERIFATPPAIHRFPVAMANRVQALARRVAEDYDGDGAALWRTASSGAQLVDRLASLPGFGPQKAKIFAALLGKQLGVRPRGWRAASEPYGADGSHLSVADVTSAESLQKVRAHKKQLKAAAKNARQR